MNNFVNAAFDLSLGKEEKSYKKYQIKFKSFYVAILMNVKSSSESIVSILNTQKSYQERKS